MALDTTAKAEIIKEYQRMPGDTGSPEVQIALLSADIKQLTEAHFKAHKKDNHSRRGLLKKVSLRNRLLNYLESSSQSRYKALVERLGLRVKAKQD